MDLKKTWRVKTDQGENIVAAITSCPEKTLMAFDFDGTLAEIQSCPEDVFLYPKSGDVLAEISSVIGTIAIVTGRQVKVLLELTHLDKLPGFENIQVYGQYGMEKWDANTGQFLIPPVPLAIRQAKHELNHMLVNAKANGHDVEGILLEDKERSIGVHYRNCADPADAEQWLYKPIEKIVKNNNLILAPGRYVYELLSFSCNKGDALKTLVKQESPQNIIFFGDDLADIPAFEACWAARSGERNCVNVVCASNEAAELDDYADIECYGPAGLADWLGNLHSTMKNSGIKKM